MEESLDYVGYQAPTDLSVQQLVDHAVAHLGVVCSGIRGQVLIFKKIGSEEPSQALVVSIMQAIDRLRTINPSVRPALRDIRAITVVPR
jgi:hypothetical protein